MLLDGEILEEGRLLGHDAQVGLRGRGLRHDVVAEDADLTGGGEDLRGDLPDQRRLARSVRSQDAQDLARLGLQGDITVGPRAALIPLVQFPHRQGRTTKV